MATKPHCFQGVAWVLGICSIVLLGACEQDRVSPAPELIVDTFEVSQALFESERKFHGKVVPADLTRMSFRIRGTISRLAVQAGQQVSKGRVLASVDDSIQRQVLAHAKARYQLSERQLERAESLHSRGSFTLAQRDQLRAEFRLATANLGLAQASLSYTVIKAPFDGIVEDVQKELHEAVNVGESIVTLYRSDRVDVMVNMSDTLPARIHRIQDITDTQSHAVFAGYPKGYAMSYLKNSTARNPKTQAFQFWFSMPTQKIQFPPGLPVTITTDFQEADSGAEEGLLVPLTALESGEREDIFRVWRYQEGTVAPISVRIGRVTQQGALIHGDLQPGDRVVTSGLSRLSPGMSVINKQIQNQEQ